MTDRTRFAVSAVLLWLLLFAGAFVTATQSQSQTQSPQSPSQQKLIPSLKGDDLYRYYCASCHGTDARGKGPAAPSLRQSPPDLTQIARRNGGTFPRQRVERIIAGINTPSAHGSRQMPVWGPVFGEVEWDQNLGQVRLNNLAKYLESIQQK
jgi:mono/diheme cytochrome c family protein